MHGSSSACARHPDGCRGDQRHGVHGAPPHTRHAGRMSFYSDFAPRRIRQIVADAAAGVVVILSIMVGVAVHGLIAAFGEVWRALEDAGTGFEDTMGDVGENLAGVPLIGEGIRAPFDGLSDAGEQIALAGQAGQDLVAAIALFAGFGVALLPISLLLIVWLWPRLRFARRSAETRALLALDDGQALLALRALDGTTAELAKISRQPVRDWLGGDPRVTHQLAALQARTSGVRIPNPAGAHAG